jgi:hypothetical protein
MRKAAVIGPKDSVARILHINKASKKKLDLIPCIYDDLSQVSTLIKENAARVQGWIFSGPAPFLLANKELGKIENAVYCSFSGAGLYRCFLQIAANQRKVLQRLSIDFPENEYLKESIEDLGIPLKDSFITTYNGDCQPQKLIDFHYDLWKSGKTEAAISSIEGVYKALKEKGVPAYRNTGTAQTIREALRILNEKFTASYFKSTQVGFQIIEICDYDQVIEKTASQYDLQLLELQIKKDLVVFSKKLSGYLLENGIGNYELFSSRGTIERELDSLQDVIQKISHDINASISVGIGFGDTVSSAQYNARIAILHAKKQKAERTIIIHEDGVFVESVGEQQKPEVVYTDHSDDEALLEKLHAAKVGIKAFKRIQATVKYLGWDSFTSSQVAEELSVSERNIRRIINGLCEVNLIECVGEEQTTVRGRPSKVYRFI